MITRKLPDILQKRLNDKKAIIIYGARQVGKTTMLENYLQTAPNIVWWNCDESDIREMLEKPTSTYLRTLIGSNNKLVIDEAQRVENIGITIKLILDNIKDVKVIATGSSSFELANKISEPLTGRKWEYKLYPLSYAEMAKHHGILEEKRLLKHRLIYGYYPDIINNPGDEIELLKLLSSSYLYKDILKWENLKNSDKLETLLKALAFQIGSEVSYSELGQIVGMDKDTVKKYISLLEKAFIIYRVGSFSRNLRNELKKSRKIYFYDNGIRNAVINQFNILQQRNDNGALWENFIMSERRKFVEYNRINCSRYFWRTKQKQEIDYIEESNGNIKAFEIKWNLSKKVKLTPTFANAYPDAEFKVITPENFEEFIMHD